MKCKRAQPNLLDYSRGLLRTEEAGTIRAHLEGCAACRAALEEDARLAEKFAALPEAGPRADVWPLVHARLAVGRPRLRVFGIVSRPYARRFVGAAAACVVLIVAMVAVGNWRSASAEKQRIREAIALMQVQPEAAARDSTGGTTDAMMQVLEEQVPKDEM